MSAAPATYPDTLDFLYNRLPMFSRVGADAIKKDLTNTRVLCAALGNPQDSFKSVHVAGTNGKGSVSHMLAAVLQESGYRTGLYTSPHLKDFRERIRVGGAMVAPEFVVDFVHAHFGLITDISPSFFELTVAMAFKWFADSGCEIAVVEVGLGGRLDSTNIIRPALSVITNISYDHSQILGNTLGEIAGEKAGIIKPHTPVVIGETRQETRNVFLQKAAACDAPVVFADTRWEVTGVETAGAKRIVHVRPADEGGGPPAAFEMELAGAYQSRNLVTVLTALQVLREHKLRISEEAVRRGLAQVVELTGLRGRWEVIGQKPLTVADVAHNIAGIAEVMWQALSLRPARLHIVAGFVKDKDVSGILDLFPREALCYFCQADIPRALEAEKLAAMAAARGLAGQAYPGVRDALEAARRRAEADELVLVCGSVFVVAEILP